MEQALRVSFLLWAGGLCCFAGYWLRRWLVTATGVVGGLALGFALARFFGLPDWWQGTCLAAALGIALGILGFRLHKLGLFLFCGACAAALAYDLMTAYLTVWMEPWMLWAAVAALGLLVGWAVYRFYRPAVILSTAAFGGFLLARTVFSLLSAAAAVQYLGRGMGLTAAIAGAVLQFRGRK